MTFFDFILNRPGAAASEEPAPEPPRKSWAEEEQDWIARRNAKIAAMETVEEVAEYVSKNYALPGMAHGCAAVGAGHQAVVKAGLIRIAELVRQECFGRRPGPNA